MNEDFCLPIAQRDYSFSAYETLTRTRTCAYQGVRNVSFLENFAYVLNEWSLSVIDISNIQQASPEGCIYVKLNSSGISWQFSWQIVTKKAVWQVIILILGSSEILSV